MADSALITNSDSANFQKDVLESTEPVLVDFWAEWCTPCKLIAPVLEKLAPEFQGKLKIVKVDLDANMDLGQNYSIFSIPNMKIFHQGQPVDEIVGFMPEPQMRAVLTQKLNAIASADSMPMAA